MRVESEKTKRIIEQSVLVTSINERMENKNRKIFKNQFIFRNLYTALVKNSTTFTQDIRKHWRDISLPDITESSFCKQYKEKLDKEMQKFTGKVYVGDEAQSEVTDATK